MSKRTVGEWLGDQSLSFPDQAAVFVNLADLYAKRLWHQLGLALLSLFKDSSSFGSSFLLEAHENVVEKCADFIDPLVYAQLAVAASDNVDMSHPSCSGDSSIPPARSFIEQCMKREKISVDEPAIFLLSTHVLQVVVASGDKEEARLLVEKCTQLMDSYVGIFHAVCQSSYYKAVASYHKLVGSASKYFKNSMFYLTYTPLESLSTKQKVDLATDVGLYALLGEDIYSFGELLIHPIVNTVVGTEQEWVMKLLTVFNAGDISTFEKMFKDCKSSKGVQQQQLVNQEPFLRQKMLTMGLMEMVFTRSPNDRMFTFEQIASALSVPKDSVEVLLIKAFSLKCVKGQIDEVDQTVRFTWVLPRVLNMQQLSTMKERILDWKKSAHATAEFVQEHAAELVNAQ